jgi:hypothetical protein
VLHKHCKNDIFNQIYCLASLGDSETLALSSVSLRPISTTGSNCLCKNQSENCQPRFVNGIPNGKGCMSACHVGNSIVAAAVEPKAADAEFAVA